MESGLPSHLKLRLFGIYIALGLLTSGGMLMSNLYISRYSWDRVWWSMKGLAIGYPVMIVMLVVLTHYRLRRYPSEASESIPAQRVKRWVRLMNFPSNVFWFVFIFGAVVAQCIQYMNYRSAGLLPANLAEGLPYIKSTLFNTSTFLVIALIHYSWIRLLFRDIVRRLSVTELGSYRFSSIAVPLIMTFCGAVGFASLRLLWYVLDGELSSRPVRTAVMILVVVIVFIIALSVFIVLSYLFLRDLNRIIERLRLLASRKRTGEFTRIPIVSRYETGELLSVFNALQGRYEQEYEQWDKDLRLARSVQQKLLNDGKYTDGEWDVSAASDLTMEVGGGLFDIVPVREGKIIVMVGSATGSGMPAALVMSAAMMLFRTYAREGMEPAQLLAALNHALSDALQPDDPKVSMGIGVIDTAAHILQFAAAGPVHAILERKGTLHSLRSDSAPPLAADSEAAYREEAYPLEQGCRLLICSLPAGFNEHPDKVKGMMAHAVLPFPEFTERFVQEVRGQKENHSEDMTLLLAHWRGQTE